MFQFAYEVSTEAWELSVQLKVEQFLCSGKSQLPKKQVFAYSLFLLAAQQHKSTEPTACYPTGKQKEQ